MLNLVCPIAFGLGEAHRIVVLSVTKGEDKPRKYPDMFAASDLVLVNKIFLLPHLDFDIGAALANVYAVNPAAKVLEFSAHTGEGLSAWLAWIDAACDAVSAGHVKAMTAE